MSEPVSMGLDWQDAEAYAWAAALPQTGWAWEFLRRDRDYRTAWDVHLRTPSSVGTRGSGNFPAPSSHLWNSEAWALVRFRGSVLRCAVLRGFLASRSLPRSPSSLRRSAKCRTPGSRQRDRSFRLQYSDPSRCARNPACALRQRRTLPAIAYRFLDASTCCLDDRSRCSCAAAGRPLSSAQAAQRSLHLSPASSASLSSTSASEPSDPGLARPRCVA